MTQSELEVYKTYVAKRLNELSPYLQKYALGDFSEEIEVPEKEDEFTELLVGISLMVDDIKELIQEQEITIKNFKRSETELKKSQNLLKAILDGTPEVIFVKDRMGRYVVSNPVRNKMLDLSEEEVLGKDDTAFYPPEIAQQLKDTDQSVVESGESLINEQQVVTLDGESRTYINSKHPWRDGLGQIIGVIGIAHDITERVRMEKSLRESEAKMSSIFKASPTGIGLVRDRILLQVNDQISEMTGYSQEELVGNSARILYPTNEEFEFVGLEKYAQIQERGKGTVETRWQRKDGRFFNVLLSSTPIDPADPSAGVTFTALDITKRKQAELKNQERQRFLEGVLSAAPDAIITLNADSVVSEWNKGAEGLFQYTAEEAIGNNIDILITHDDPAIHKEAAGLSVRVSKGKSVDPFETIRYRKDGTPVNVILAGSPVFINESFEGSVAVYTDISVQKQTEQEVRNFANQTEALLEIERAITSTLNLEIVLEIIMSELSKVIPYDSISLQLLQGQSLEIIACRGFNNPAEIVGLVFPLDSKYPNHRVIEDNAPLVFDDITQEYPHFVEESDKYKSGRIRSWLGVPLISKEIVTGMIALDRSKISPFSKAEIQLATAIAGQASLAIENAHLFSESQQRLERLSSLRRIDQAITSSFDLQVTLDILLEIVIRQLEVDATVVLLYNPDLQTLEYHIGKGFLTQALRFTKIQLGQGHAGRAALERRIIQVSDLRQLHTGFLRSPEFRNERFVSYVGVPLIAKGNIIGVLEIYHRQKLNPDTDWITFLETLAGQAAIAIDNINLFNDLQQSNIGLIQAYDATIEGWANALEMRDMETEGHSRRVIEITTEIAKKMDIRGVDLAHLRRGALLHDIGKMAVPDAILQKPGKLSEEEWEIMRQHPVYAFEWLSGIKYLQPALEIPYCHHEKWDGTGYPRGLKGEEIPLPARIFAIVDVWDALHSDRPYRKAWTKEKTLAYIEDQSGIHFDPKVVEAFTNYMDDNPEID